MSNLFENDNGVYQVLVNPEGQHSLWPEPLEVPPGWAVAHPADSRENCLAYVEEHWTDMRPASLVAAMEEAGTGAGNA